MLPVIVYLHQVAIRPIKQKEITNNQKTQEKTEAERKTDMWDRKLTLKSVNWFKQITICKMQTIKRDTQAGKRYVPPLACYKSGTVTWTGFHIFFGRNVTHKVGNQKTLYYFTSNKLCFCITWQNGETQKLHLSLKCIDCVQPVATWFLQPFRLTTHTNAAAWLPKSCNQCVRLWTVVGLLLGAWFRKRSRERCRSWTVLHAQTAQCTSALSSGFPFRKVMLKHYIGEVGKRSIVWFFTFSVRLLPKLSWWDHVCQDYSKWKLERFWDTAYTSSAQSTDNNTKKSNVIMFIVDPTNV